MIPNSFDDWVIIIMFTVLIYGAWLIRLEQLKQTKEEENVEIKQTKKSK